MSYGEEAPTCVPTWRGYVETTRDALLIFHAYFNGVLIVSGSVFIYNEADSGMKRWTDGIPWSPSRGLTNFLLYRQLIDSLPLAKKRMTTKRSQESIETRGQDVSRSLVGSLTDSYDFHEKGLPKKTMTVTVKNTQHHLVSYYSLNDAKYRLKTPRDDPVLKNQPVSDALLSQKKFKYLNLDHNGEGPSGQMGPSPFSYPGDNQI